MSHRRLRYLSVLFVPLIAVAATIGLVQAAPDGGVVGNGTPASCTEAALNTALAGGGTVTFNCGGPKTILLTTAKEILLPTAINGGGVITLSGGLAVRPFRVNVSGSLALSNITLEQGYYNSGSGGAISAFGPLTLTNVTIQNSLTASPYCGGAVIASSETFITNTKFYNNIAVLGGGAICVRSQPGTKVQVVNSLFSNNQALDVTTGLGGALYVEYGTAQVLDSAFVANFAHFGGAVYAAAGNATILLEGSPTESAFLSKLQLNANTSIEDGGAIYNKGALTVNNAYLFGNQTPTQTILAGYGGAIYNDGVLTLANSILSRSQGRFGGGVFVGNSAGARAVVDRTLFLRNVSGSRGGGLYMNTGATVTVTNSAFNLNRAEGVGGGLSRFNATLRIFNSSFTQNTAAVGGGLDLEAGPSPTSGPYVLVRNITVANNTATSSQGGAVYNNGLVELYSTTMISNSSGVFSALGGNTRFRNSVLHNPGALNCDGDGTASISDDSRNFSTDVSCPLPSSQTGIGLDPQLGPLSFDPFVPTSYYMPLAGSPLLKQAFNCQPRDQRNAPRPTPCDIGAVEYAGIPNGIFIPLARK